MAFITASSYLDGVSMGGVRALLRDAFDELWIIDLGGEGRGAQTEENVFDIRTPVAVAVGVRKGVGPAANEETAADCTVRYLRIAGTRADKLAALRRTGLDDVSEIIFGAGLDGFTPEALGVLRLAPGHRLVPLDPLRLPTQTHLADRRDGSRAQAAMAASPRCGSTRSRRAAQGDAGPLGLDYAAPAADVRAATALRQQARPRHTARGY